VPDESGRKVRNNLRLISRWKIFDNLRRSLTTPAMVCGFLPHGPSFPARPGCGVLFVVITMAFPVYMHVTRA